MTNFRPTKPQHPQRPASYFTPKRAVTLDEARADGTSALALRRLSMKHAGKVGDDLLRVAEQLAANDNRVGRRAA